MVFDYGIQGCGPTLQFGKQGSILSGASLNQFIFLMADGTTIAPIIVATPTVSAQAANKSYVDLLSTNVGTTAGGTYSPNLSAHYIQGAVSVIDSTNKLDTTLYTAITNTGLNSNGSYIPNSGAHYIASAISVADSANKLDTSVYQNYQTITTVENAIGLSSSGSYLAPTSNYLGSTTSVVNALTTLDTELYNANTSSGFGITGTKGTYSSTNFVLNSDSLVTAVGKLDAAVQSSKGNSVHDAQLTTTGATNILSVTPTTLSNCLINVFYRVTGTTTNVTIAVTYTDHGTLAQTINLLPMTAQSVGNYYMSAFVNAAASYPVTVTFTVGTTNQVYASATITQS